MHHIGELDRVPDEEDRQVVSDQVIVPLSGIEFDSKPAGIPYRVCRPPCPDDCREPDENRRLFLWVLEKLGFRIGCHIFEDLKIPVSSGTFCVHYAFRNPLPVKMRQLLDQVNILQEDRPTLPGGEGVLVIGNRNSLVSGESFFVHDLSQSNDSNRLRINIWFRVTGVSSVGKNAVKTV
jgi:hypothetical protein